MEREREKERVFSSFEALASKCILSMCVCMNTHASPPNAHTQMYVHLCTCTHTHTHMYVHTHTHIHTHTLSLTLCDEAKNEGGWRRRKGEGEGWKSGEKGHSPILTGNPAGSCKVIKSRSLAKWALLVAIRSMIGKTCSCKESGKSSHSHSVALNFWILVDCSMGRPMSRSPRVTSELKYSSGVMDEGL